MERLATIALWVLHWAFQGLKLWLFTIVAFMAAFLGCAPFAAIDAVLKKLLEPGQFANVASIVISGMGLIVGLAVGTAALASMLNEHPLLPFRRKQVSPENPTGRTSRVA